MPIIYSKTAVQAVIPLTNNTVGFPSRIADWLADACENYLHIDRWKSSDDFKTISRYDARADAHINRIPVEILGEIFMHCLTENHPTQTTPLPTSLSPSSQADPQILGEVCRFWRDVTLSTPALWSKIWIYQPQHAQVQRVALWLNRSRAYPLDIRIVQFLSSVTRENHAAADEILSLLVSQVYRWRKIYFRFSSSAQRPLLLLPVGATSKLESAYANTWKWDHTSADRFWKVLHSSPSLRHADWGSYTKGLPSHVPWAQLTSVTIRHGLSVEECISILQGAQQLVALRIHNVWSYDTLVDLCGPLILPRLQHLSFLGCIESTPFFNRLTLPSLISLEITNTNPYSHDARRSCVSFRNLLRRSACRLEKFRFLNPIIDADDLHDYLSAPQLHSLQELDLEVPITDQTIITLTPDIDGATRPYLLPNLEVISIEETRTSDGRISDMILSRLSAESGAPLKSASVRLKAQSHPNDLAIFQSIIEHNNWLHVFVT